jgi:hypothetical protein
MIIPTPPNETAVTILFHKDLADWTKKDRDTILRRLAAFMRKASNDRKRRPRKVVAK